MTAFLERIRMVEFGWRDAVDILVVAFVLYYVLVLIRGTRAMQMAIGIMILFGANFVAHTFGLLALESISRQILFYLPFAIVVLFQQEIRKALATFGRSPLSALFSTHREVLSVDEIIEAATELAATRTGALIAIERTQELRLYTEAAKRLDALVSGELLISVFRPDTPLHDGAVVIEGNRIVAAGVFLPLAAESVISRRHGTRHRAALGLSEETDAFVIVVSEENGTIGVALDGALYENLELKTLAEMLKIHVLPKESRG